MDGIDCDEIEANSSLTLDGGFDFNSIWNSDFRNQAGRSSLAKESTIPPENFKMFFKEQVTSFTEDNKFNGNLKITIGENKFDLKVPFQTLRTGSEGEICNVWDLMEDYYSESGDNSNIKISWGICLYLHDGTHMKQESMTYLVIMKYRIINTVGKIREKIY